MARDPLAGDTLLHLDLPRQPHELAERGLCASGLYDPDLWSSRLYRQRQVAIGICRACPVLALCLRWALQLPGTDTAAIYAGLWPAERIRLRQALAGAITQPEPEPEPAAG